MSVIALRVSARTAHPDADSLFIYELVGDRTPTCQVIANAENDHPVGAVVATALVGTTLADGTAILRASIRGVSSLGMILGRTDAPLDTDLTAAYGATVADGATDRFIRWPSVELLHNVNRSLALRGEREEGFVRPAVTYRAKVKLDGTQAAIQLRPDGRVLAQSRTSILSSTADNAGFGAWTARNAERWAALRGERVMTLFGEWCGHGIQKRTAIAKIGKRVFALFAVVLGDPDLEAPTLITEPDAIANLVVPGHFPEGDVLVLPWYGAPFSLDFGDTEALRCAVEAINAVVDEVETCDPWVMETFGVRGIGEGVVMYPQGLGYDAFFELAFKAKGGAHQVVKQARPAQVDPEVARSVEEFVRLFVTEARLQQGLTEGCGGTLEMARMGAFLAWFGKDVQKESVAELAASGLAWTDVQKAVSTAARDWFKQQVEGSIFA